MITKYTDVMKSPYLYDSFELNPFRLFDSLSNLDRESTRLTSKSYRVEETDEGLTLSIDLPGVKSKDLSVHAVGREVKVEGKLRGENFSYSYRVSKSYDPDTTSATLEDGVLTLVFGKSENTKSKSIDVRVK